MGGNMRLRNKKTGETFNAIIREYSDGDDDYEIVVYDLDAYKRLKDLPLNSAHAVISDRYKSLAELNKVWEDYGSKEPLIKDEKIRKAVKVWAEACGVSDSEKLRVCQGHGCSFIQLQASDAQFSLLGVDYGIPYDGYRTIAELCGEEETPEPKEPSFIDLDERIREKAAAEKLYKGENDIHLTEEEE